MTTVPPVTFVYSDFIGQFGQFSGLSAPQAQGFFNRAGVIFGNETTNPAFCTGVPNMTTLMYLLTAHIAWLNAPRDVNGNPSASGSPPPSTVGRVNSASEGSVSVGLDMGDANEGSPSQAWYMQTPWGAEYWAGTAMFRTMNYSPRQTLIAPMFLGRGPFRGYGR